MIQDMVPRDLYCKHPIAIMIQSSRGRGRVARFNNVLRSDSFYLARQYTLRNHHEKDMIENRENPNNYKSVLKSGEISRYLSGTNVKFNRMFENSVRTNTLCFVI